MATTSEKEAKAAEETAETTGVIAVETEEEYDDDVSMVIEFKKPYKFEGEEYTEVDLSGLDNLTANDMIAINKRMSRTSQGIDVLPEVTLEYACEIAAKGTRLPIEFFRLLPPKEAMKVKSRVMAFLFGSA